MSDSSIEIPIDNYRFEEIVAILESSSDKEYGYVVTPNVDHIIRFCTDQMFQQTYQNASYVLLDSQFVAIFLRVFRKIRVNVCRGSDLTEYLFQSVIRPEDRIVVVGSTDQQVASLKKKYQLKNVFHHEPPMGFINDGRAVERCLKFVEARSPFRFCFLAVGSPQQEILAKQLKLRNKVQGLALCVGASIDFLTGSERRAPKFFQRWGIEWLFRLVGDPLRLSHRYLIRGPRFFFLFRHINFHFRKPRKP